MAIVSDALTAPPEHSAPVPEPMGGGHPILWPPRGSAWIGDYSLRDLAAKIMIQLDDVAEIERYRQANQLVMTRTDPRPSVVLMGDSITELWPADRLKDAASFNIINRGVSGQNSSMMLLRFQADVIDLAPDAVVILAGSNDLRAYAGDPEGLGPAALERLSRNLTAMTNMAKGCGIAVVLAALPPVGGDLASVARSPAAVRAVNAWIAAFAEARGYLLADYHAVLADEEGLLSDNLSEDGVHPNSLAYDRMQPVLLEALVRLNPEEAQT